MKKTVIHETIFVDFKLRTVLKRTAKKIRITDNSLDFSNFNPVPQDSNFANFSEKDRMDYSNHILAHIHEASFSDLVHWANMGMIDMEAVNKALRLNSPSKKTRRKK